MIFAFSAWFFYPHEPWNHEIPPFVLISCKLMFLTLLETNEILYSTDFFFQTSFKFPTEHTHRSQDLNSSVLIISSIYSACHLISNILLIDLFQNLKTIRAVLSSLHLGGRGEGKAICITN